MKSATAFLAAILLMAAALTLAKPQAANGVEGSHRCPVCHANHRSAGESLIKHRDLKALCLSCHGARGESRFRVGFGHYDVSDEVPSPGGKPCVGCHTPHGEPALFLNQTRSRIQMRKIR